MIDVISLYNDVVKDSVNTPENGNMTIGQFNRLSRRAENRLLDWLTGKLEGTTLPALYSVQKDKSWLSPFIARKQAMVKDGVFLKPEDYYEYDNFYAIEPSDYGCDIEEIRKLRMPITIKNGAQFNELQTTFIDELKPENGNYITTLQDNFILAPEQILDADLVYIRLPKYAHIEKTVDQTYNNEVPDPSRSFNYEWPEAVREYLIGFITDFAANKDSNQEMKVMNAQTNKP